MKLLGLIGYPLKHSFSVRYFAEKFRKENITGFNYRNFPIENIDQLPVILDENTELLGLNVTIPYKEQVIRFIDELNPVAAKIGAVNTIKVGTRNGKRFLTGYNTDAYGFYHSIEPYLKKNHNSALILGTGGASKAIKFVLTELGIDYLYVSRDPKEGQIGYRDLCLPIIDKFQLIINTTPLGTYPDVNIFPDIPYDLLAPGHLLYDLVYNPPETEFLRLGRMKGATVINGLRMLELQAEKSWEIWNS